jgi:hypothetical protein
LEYAGHWSRFQREADVVTGLQPRQGLPVVPVLRFDGRADRNEERENQE